jgi:hypothetical protein
MRLELTRQEMQMLAIALQIAREDARESAAYWGHLGMADAERFQAEHAATFQALGEKVAREAAKS